MERKDGKVYLTVADVTALADARVMELGDTKTLRAYGVPRGGVSALLAMLAVDYNGSLSPTSTPTDADIFVDDVIDSGETMRDYCDKYPGVPFVALVDKTDTNCPYKDDWVVFPWEGTVESSIESNITRLIQFVGDDPHRGGLQETPARVAKAWQFWCKGYTEDPADVLKVFEDGAENYDEMVLVKDIPFYSKCEHHMADIFGTASIAYIPGGKIVGLSKLSRLLSVFARRLQVQERLTNQIADALEKHLGAKGVGVVIKARHMCMESRGICQQGHHTVTSALRGVIKESAEARAEFMALVK